MKFLAIVFAWLIPLMMITASGVSSTYRLIGVGLVFGAAALTKKILESED